MGILKLVYRNLQYKKLSSLILIILVAVAVTLLTSITLISTGIEEGTLSRIEDYDLIVGSEGSPFQLVFSTLYHYENPPGNIDYHIYEKILDNDSIRRAVPIALGDNYANFRIVGTNTVYFEKYGSREQILKEGQLFKEAGEAVIGYQVAENSDLNIGDTFHSIHGFQEEEGHTHDDLEFNVTGILEEQHNSDDYYIFTPYESYWILHSNCDHDHSHEHEEHTHDEHTHDHKEHDHDNHSHEHETHDHDEHSHLQEELTAVLVESGDMVALSQLINHIENDHHFRAQGVFLSQIFRQIFNIFGDSTEIIRILSLISLLMAILTIFITLINSAMARIRDLAVLRMIGASQNIIVKIIVLEAVIISIIGAIVGSIAGYFIANYAGIILSESAGISITVGGTSFIMQQIGITGLLLLLTIMVSLIAAYTVYRENPLEKLR